MDDLIVVVSQGAVMILQRGESQKVRKVTAAVNDAWCCDRRFEITRIYDADCLYRRLDVQFRGRFRDQRCARPGQRDDRYGTRIGSPYVIEAMNTLIDGSFTACGYEANGGFLLGTPVDEEGCHLPALPTRDAVLPMLAVWWMRAMDPSGVRRGKRTSWSQSRIAIGYVPPPEVEANYYAAIENLDMAA